MNGAFPEDVQKILEEVENSDNEDYLIGSDVESDDDDRLKLFQF